MSTRLNLLPDPALERLKPALAERLAAIGASIDAEQFRTLLDPLMRRVLQSGFIEAGAHEGTVWLLDGARENLVAAFNTGPDADKIMRGFKQPLNSGLICMVFASEQPFLENEIRRNAQQSRLLDTMLQTETHAMIAVPFYFLKSCRGVVSCVQRKTPGSGEPDPPGFQPAHLAIIEQTSAALSRLIDFRLLGQVTGWIDE